MNLFINKSLLNLTNNIVYLELFISIFSNNEKSFNSKLPNGSYLDTACKDLDFVNRNSKTNSQNDLVESV